MSADRVLSVGDVIWDNDPRQDGRRLVVISTDSNYVYARGAGMVRIVRIMRKRVHTDGKPRRTGFSLQQNTETTP